MFEGDVPLPRVFSFLSFKLIASDAPSGICEGRWKRGEVRKGGGRHERTEVTGSGVRRVAQNSIIKHVLRGLVVLRGVYACVCVCLCVSVLHSSRLVCRSLAGLIKVKLC